MTTIRITPDVPVVAGETILCPRRTVYAGSASSWPTYRLFFSLPPLLEVGLLVTDHRVLLHGLCLRLVAHVQSLWFTRKDGREQLDSVPAGRVPIFGDVLEFHSIESARRWYRSQRMWLRLFVRGAAEVAAIIERQLRHGRRAGG